MNFKDLAKEIVDGRRLNRSDDLTIFLTGDLAELSAAADYIRAKLKGAKVDLCTIINGKSGRCSENCRFCAQSAHNHTTCKNYPFLDVATIVAAAKANEAAGVDRFSIVTSGRTLAGAEFAAALAAFKQIHQECRLSLCASMGFLTRDQLKALKAAGVTSYHHNIETSRRFFPQICTTHTFEEKIATIRLAQAEGLAVCSGGIIGMGETSADRLDMALTLAELKVLSIPINILMAHVGTPLENMPQISEEEVLRTVAFFRFLNPLANIRLAGGRKLLKNNGISCFSAGASATITGDMLTTTGSTIKQDQEMLKELGRETDPLYGSDCAGQKIL